MGGCLHSHHSIPSNTQTTKPQLQEKKTSTILSADTFAQFFSNRHAAYLQRKYISVCESKGENLSCSKMAELFSYLGFSNETLKKLYDEFKGSELYLVFETFTKECQNFISCSNNDLAKSLYRLYFSELKSGTTLTNKFQGQFRRFFKHIPMVSTTFQSTYAGNLKQLQGILDRRKEASSDEETCKWIIDNVDLKKFRLFFVEYGLQLDEKEAYDSYIFDKTSMSFNGECSIMYSKWCDSMENYMHQKYERQFQMNMKHSISVHELMKNHSSQVRMPRAQISRKQTIDNSPQSQLYEFSRKKQFFVEKYDLAAYPGKIDNSSLSGYFKWEIKPNIKTKEYYKVSIETMKKLYLCYGGGPRFNRELVKGYLDLKPYFVNSHRFQYSKQNGTAYLTQEEVNRVSSKQMIKYIIPHIVNKHLAYHRNIGEKWQIFPFEQSEETVEEVFTTTSFLIYMTMDDRKEFQKRYITKEVEGDLPKVGDVYESIDKNLKEKVCVRNVKKQSSKFTVKFVSLTQIHPDRKIFLNQFKKTYKESLNQLKTTFKRKNRAGIENLGNTCYMNATLQNIIAVREGTDLFKEDKTISKQIQKIIKQIEKRKKSIFPVEFKTAFDLSFPYFKGDDQHDAHEFLISLLTKLEEEDENVVKKEFSTKITSEIKCKLCKKKKENIQSARIISLPLRDYNKKQMKIDLVTKNKDITTFKFQIDPTTTFGEWMETFRKLAKVKNFHLYEITNSDFSRYFSPNLQSEKIKTLKIESQDYLVAYEMDDIFLSCRNPQLKKHFYVFKDQNKSHIAKIEDFVTDRRSTNRIVTIKYKDGDKFINENVHESQLIEYPNASRKIRIKILNYDADYEEKIGIPFAFEMPAEYPLLCVREWLQYTIGRFGYILRIAPIGNPEQCISCKKRFCDKWKCFTEDEEKYPLEWYENRIQFVVRWKTSFQYKQKLKRKKMLSESVPEEQNNPKFMDSFETAFQLFEQPSQVIMNCSLCNKQNVTIQSREKVTSWPNILIFHLKRFRVKEGGIIKLFTKWRLQKEVEFGGIKYILKGVILHIGINIYSGHYTAVIDGYKYDNDVVKECDLDIPPEQIYMLFYLRV